MCCVFRQIDAGGSGDDDVGVFAWLLLMIFFQDQMIGGLICCNVQ